MGPSARSPPQQKSGKSNSAAEEVHAALGCAVPQCLHLQTSPVMSMGQVQGAGSTV